MSQVSVFSNRLVRASLVVALAAVGQIAQGVDKTASAAGADPVASPIGPHVTVLQSCAGTDVRVDVFMVNVHNQAAKYQVEVTNPYKLPAPLRRDRNIEPLGQHQASFVVPGDSLSSYNVTVRRNQAEVHRQPVNARCNTSTPPQSPEASVANGCRDGAGFLRTLYVNPDRSRQDWSVSLTSLTDPSKRTVQRNSRADSYARELISIANQPDGTYRLDVSRSRTLIRSFYVKVDCVAPAWNLAPEQLRVLEIGFVPPSRTRQDLVDQSTSIYFRGDETVEQLSTKIRGETDYLAAMLETGSRSNNGFGVQGVDVQFVDRVEIRERPPVDTKFLLKREATKLDINDPRLQPNHPSAFDRNRVRCGGTQIPAEYKGAGIVPNGQCFYLSEISRPNYPMILENQLRSLPRNRFSGSGQSFCSYIEKNQIDQVWIWTDHGHQVEPAEAVMSSRTGVTFNAANEDINLNGQRLYPQCGKTYTAFNFNYTRSPSVHVFIHAIEGLMSWGPWKYSAADKSIFGWEDPQRRRLSGTFGIECGDAHWAPNVPRRPGEDHWTEYRVSIADLRPSGCFGWNPAGVPSVPIPNPLVHTADTRVTTSTRINCATWNGCPPDGSSNRLHDPKRAVGETATQVQNYEMWWLQQLPGLGFQHLAVYNGELYRVNSPWSLLADPDRFIGYGKTNESAQNESLLLANFP